MMKIANLVSFLTATSLATSVAQGARTPALSKDEVVSGVQVGIGECAFAPVRSEGEEGRIASVIAAAAISKGVNLLTSAVTAAAQSKTWTATGSRNFQASSKGFPQCVQVVRGKFFANKTDLGTWANSWPGQKGPLTKNGLFIAETPDFFFEGEIAASNDSSALAIRPVYSAFSRPIGTRLLRPGKDRSIAIFLAITVPGAKPNLETAPAATIILGEQLPPTYKQYPLGGTTYRSPLESTWFTFAKVDTLKPFTLHALVTETQGPDAFMAFIASVLSDEKVKTAITTQASQILIPSVGAAAEATEAQAAVTAANNADQKLATAITKLDACRTSAPTGLVVAASQAKVAVRDFKVANDAAPQTERSTDISQELITKIDLSKPAKLKQACEDAYQAIAGEEGGY